MHLSNYPFKCLILIHLINFIIIRLTFLEPTALSRYMDLTLAELSIMEMIKARFTTFTINNIAYQNHITRIMYCRSTFGGNRHLKFVPSSKPEVPPILTRQLLSNGNTKAKAWFLSIPKLKANIQSNPRDRNLPSITRFVNHMQNITFKTSKI